MRNPRRLTVDERMIREHGLSTDRPPADALFWTLWESCFDIAQHALATSFVQGIKDGVLSPVSFGSFSVNDAYYCFHGVDDYEKAAARASHRTVRAFLEKKAASYRKYNDQFSHTWHVKDASVVIPAPVTRQYSEFESRIAQDDEPIYTLVAMLPCEYLWAWLGQHLAPWAKPGNLYSEWITGNQGFSGSYAMGNFIESRRQDLDAEKALEFYRQAITFEWQNFIAGTP